MNFSEFILAHDGDDLGRLALARGRYAASLADVSCGGAAGFDLALTTLEVRRKLRDKVPEWYAVSSLVYPLRVSGEQCSSTATARYKASVALHAVLGGSCKNRGDFLDETSILADSCRKRGVFLDETSVLADSCRKRGVFLDETLRLADLTGGLGVDSWAFAQVFDEVLYNEMRPELAAAAEHNFRELGLTNVRVRNFALVPGSSAMPDSDRIAPLIPGSDPGSPEASVSQILGDFRPDVLFLDPARRAADGRKVFRLEDCQPDVLQLLPELLNACSHVLLKLSPMADITLVCKQLGCVKAVHVVAADGECKELLLLLERGYDGTYAMTIVEDGAVMEIPGQARDEGRGPGSVMEISGQAGNDIHGGGPISSARPIPVNRPFECMKGNIAGGGPGIKIEPLPKIGPGKFLFEPGKAMMKAGAFEVPGRYGLEKLGKHTHLYVGAKVPEELRPFGKVFEILEVVPLNNRTVKDIGKRYPKADVTARNIPLTSDQLRKKLGVADGGPVHIFGVHIDSLNDNYLLACLK